MTDRAGRGDRESRCERRNQSSGCPCSLGGFGDDGDPTDDAGDVADAEVAWADAFDTMRADYGLAVDARTGESIKRSRSRIAHLLSTDPGGSFVAEDGDGNVIGIGQSLVREECWVLSLLGVATRHQERGTGAALLAASLDYGSAARTGTILCSRDPRAMRRYALAGFDLHPSVTAHGRENRSALSPTGGVRPAGPADLELIATLDRRARGGRTGRTCSIPSERGARCWWSTAGATRGSGAPNRSFSPPLPNRPPWNCSAHAWAGRPTAGGGGQLDHGGSAVGDQRCPRRRARPPPGRAGHDPRDACPPSRYLPSGAFG